MLLLTMSLGVFIAQLDSQVVNLALHHIGDDLGAGVSALQWVMDAYNLLYAALLLTGGTLGDLYGRRRIFVLGIVLVIVGSIICIVAPNAAVLIVGRGITGVGAALDVPTSLAILSVAYRDAGARARAIGIWASCNGIAIAIGPTAGGLLVDAAGWRSVCALVLPICVLTIILAQRVVPDTRDAGDRKLDLPGQVFAILALGSLCFIAIEAPHRGWMSVLILGTGAIFVVATAALLYTEKNKIGALVPLEMFRNSEFNAALAAAGTMTFGMYAMLFLTPLYLQRAGGETAFQVGMELLPMSIVFIIVSQSSGVLTRYFGARGLMTAGLGCMGSGLLLLAMVGETPNLALIETALLIIGVGLGLNTAPVNAVAVASVDVGRSGTASGLVNTARMIGATMGIAILGAIYAVYAGQGSPQSAITGLRLAYLGGALVEFTGALIAAIYIRTGAAKPARHPA